ncbi:hypothetical protein HO173_003618 [Letharia columbiana]|uniref:Uncharacterized protein n=1 Tax=Letharia columbiana TaxID=112416 RepID=A0A8H6L7F7_9LECA|nr:uncharacterized protein HO173_003618 [Letharia columbiana]KAF6238338.1 hypothetical protein HO173_003618 [Letharia columbiana]
MFVIVLETLHQPIRNLRTHHFGGAVPNGFAKVPLAPELGASAYRNGLRQPKIHGASSARKPSKSNPAASDKQQ